MYFLYSLALSLLFLALLPYFTYQAIRHGKYKGSFVERLGRLPDCVRGDGRSTVWVHAVSVGELNAAMPLIRAIRREYPGSRVLLSTTTRTGQELARRVSRDLVDGAFYFPFDWRFAAARALDHVKPSAVVILETELWPNFLRECRRRGVVTIVANGRISPRSFARYLRVRSFISRVIQDLSLLTVQSEADRERALSLGARSDQVRVCGNLKYDVEARGPEQDSQGLPLNAGETGRDEISLPSLIVAGSTAPGEERILIAALGEVRRQVGLDQTRMVIAPRHPERFDEVARLIAQSGFRLARRSEAANSRAVDGGDLPEADVILLDTIGELAALYRFATVAFVGGSLVPRGGHNIIEPAVYAKPIVVGPHTENFRQTVTDFARADAVAQIATAGEGAANILAREFIRLLSDRDLAQAMGARARDILLKNRGATECTIAAIKAILKTDD
jgi:3-deoxy-D-manno-octulosonic-acid transferase